LLLLLLLFSFLREIFQTREGTICNFYAARKTSAILFMIYLANYRSHTEECFYREQTIRSSGSALLIIAIDSMYPLDLILSFKRAKSKGIWNFAYLGR